MNDVFITSVNLKHVRHLNNLTIALSKSEKKHLILIGKNGSGKTSLLEAVNAFLTDRQTDDEQGSRVECEFNSAEAWREQFRKGAVVAAFRPAHALKPALTEPFWQALRHGQTERIFADASLKLRFDGERVYFAAPAQNWAEEGDFNALSDGLAAVLALFGAVLMRLDQQGDNGCVQQGIVLIDQLETFLDLYWQENMLPLLTRIFPHIQFLVSTHSPVVLNSLGNAVVYDLETRLRRENPAKPGTHQDAQGDTTMNKYSEQIKCVLHEYEKLLRQDPKTASEEFRIAELRNYLAWIVQKL